MKNIVVHYSDGKKKRKMAAMVSLTFKQGVDSL